MGVNSCCCADNGCCGGTPEIQRVSTRLSFPDILGGWKVRFGIGRMSYMVEPGIYAVGAPVDTDPVLVSANYKLTFDSLRKELGGLNCWLLILDTKAVNVWCAAGKGTFGTSELTNRIAQTGLAETVSHRTLILPQLGAVGVNAHEVKRQTGFSVQYGTVRARDIKAYLANGSQATEEMRTVKFTMLDRLVLTPMEIIPAARLSLTVFGVLFLLNLFAAVPFGIWVFLAYTGALLAGTFITPVLLPFIPGRAFSFKGGLLGMAWALSYICLTHPAWLSAISYILLLPSVSAYLAMNFTGSSTYTSPSGVLKEMRIALPFIIFGTVIGGILLLVSHMGGIQCGTNI